MKPLLRSRIASFNEICRQNDELFASSINDIRRSLSVAAENALAERETIPAMVSDSLDPFIRQEQIASLEADVDERLKVAFACRDACDALDNLRKAFNVFKNESIDFIRKHG